MDEDKNGDGVENGIAFLLGGNPNADATGLLPAIKWRADPHLRYTLPVNKLTSVILKDHHCDFLMQQTKALWPPSTK